MNVKNSHCMNKFTAILFGALILSAPALQSRSYGSVAGSNPWVSSRNVAGIRQDTVSVSYAELYGKAVGGNFKASFEAPFAWTAGAEARTIKHLDRFSMIGSFSFEQMEGPEMKGTMFLRPGFYPVDIIEFTPGHKTLQTYRFNGGVSTDISPCWRIGAKMDFEADNYSKRKDLRYSSYRMDMTVAPSLQYHSGDFSAGLSYIFSKNSESVKPEQVGTAETSYVAFLDKGLYYGKNEIWTGSGVHLSEPGVNGFPVSEHMHGVAAQLQWRDLFIDGEFLMRRGKVGEKQFVWFRFPGFEVKAGLSYKKKDSYGLHSVRLGFDWLHQQTFETILEKITEGGVTTPVEYGSNLIYCRNFKTCNFDYGYAFSRWRVGADMMVMARDGLSSLMYPYVFSQGLNVLSGGLSLSCNLGRFDLKARFGASEGTSFDNADAVETDIAVCGEPDRLTAYNTGYLEYLTTAKSFTDLSVKYNFWHGLYIGLEGGWIHAPHTSFIQGTERFSGALRFGYNF